MHIYICIYICIYIYVYIYVYIYLIYRLFYWGLVSKGYNPFCVHWGDFQNFSGVGLFCLWQAFIVRNGQFLQKYMLQEEKNLRFS